MLQFALIIGVLISLGMVGVVLVAVRAENRRHLTFWRAGRWAALRTRYRRRGRRPDEPGTRQVH